ncbi:MAG TPA: hypothetical protein VGT78_01120 [Rhizomicrobium sp.]|nr:hypothetical protein [Rhizomicrobium sp.]
MEPFKPSAFTPFFRRFTDERARDLADLRALYQQVRALHYASPYSDERAVYKVGADLYGKLADLFPDDVLTPVAGLMSEITRLEKPIFEFPEIQWDIAHLTLKEQVDLNRFLTAKQYFHAHEERLIAEFKEGLERIFEVLTFGIPATFGPSPFNVPMMNVLNEPKVLIDRLYNIVCDGKYVNIGLFAELRERVYANLCQASNVIPHSEHKRPLKHAMDRDDPLNELVDIYLAGTPFVPYLNAPIPLKLTYEDRFSHMHVVGGSGAGKTQLLQHLILHDLQSEDPPALVIIDSQTDLINKLSHLAMFDPNDGALSDRLIYITPRDIEYPPALNIFDVNRERLGHYDEGTKEQVTAGVIQTFDYLFNGLLGADLTAKQGVFFRFVARLMLALPETMGRNATILDLINLMDDPAPYRKAIESLPPIQRNFFERDFPSKTFAQTKEQIRYRLNAILENPTLARLFTSPKTKIDLFTALNTNSIILVDTAKDFLKGSSSHFGRIFISLVLQAVLERAALPEHERKPAFLIVDEAAAYFDSNIDDLLTEARKYKLGCVFAHQFLDQCTNSLKSSLAANTSIKMASGVSMSDARALAPDLRTTPDFILSQPKLHFAAHIRNVTPQAVSIPVPLGVLESQPRLSGEAYEQMRELNRLRVSLPQPMRGENFIFTETPGSHQPGDPPRRNHEFRPEPQAKDDPTAASEEW